MFSTFPPWYFTLPNLGRKLGLENLQREALLPTDIFKIWETDSVWSWASPQRELGQKEAISLCLTCLLSLQASSSVAHHISDSGLGLDLPSDIPYARLDSPPAFDNTTYSVPLDPPSEKSPPPAQSSSPPLPPKVLMSSKPVTYATVIFPGRDKGGGASCEPAQDPSNGQTPPS